MDSLNNKIPFFRSIHGKLFLYFLPLSLIPLIVVSLLAYFQAQIALEQAANDKLKAVSAIKKYQIETYLAERESAAQATADLVNMLRQQAFARLEVLRDAKRSAIIRLFEEWRTDVLDMSANPNIVVGTAQLSAGFKALGVDRARALYLAKPDLEDVGDKRAYSLTHARQHRFLTGYAEIHGYEDVLLIDSAGTVVYSVKKGANFGLNLATDKDSSLGALYQQLKSAQPGQAALADVTLLNGQIAMFLGAPIYNGPTYVGLLVYQLPFQQIDRIMQVPDDMKLTGEIYLVGPDKRMRSQSSLDPVNRSVIASLMGSVDKNGVDTPGSRAALAGSSGVEILLNYRGIHSVCAYAPLDLPGLNWVIIVEESIAEAIVPQVEGTGMYILTQYTQRYGYQDVLLMAQDGYVFHTVMRGPDYQTNLLTGPYRNTHLGQLVQQIMNTGELGFADFAPYLPAGNKPVAYVAAPVIYQNKPEIVVALQLPPGWTDAVMQERTGMGQTGETLLVGPDMRMRSNSYLDSSEHSVEASFVGTVQQNGIDNAAVREALAGKTGEEVQFDTDYRGHQVIITYAPVKFGNLNWALIAKQDVAEAFNLTDRLTLVLLLVIGLAAAFVIPVTLWTASNLANPVVNLTGIATRIAGGELELQATGDGPREVASLAVAFNSMTTQLRHSLESLEQRVVEVKQAEESLREANETLQALFNYSPLAIIMLDLDGHVLLWNKAAERMYGWTVSEVLGKFLPNISVEKLAEYQTIQQQIVQGESITNLEIERQRKDGSTFWLDASIAPLRDATGKIYAQMSIGADVTERKRAEEALREKTEELDRFFSVALDLLCIADTEGHFRRLNPQWEIVLGYSLSELEGQRFLDLVHPDDQASTLAALAELNSHKIVLDFVNRYRCQDGSYRWIEWRAFPVGNLVYAAARDITERRQVEETLRLTQLAVDRARDAIHWVGPNGQMLYVNEATCQSLGYTREELLAMTVFDIDPNFSKETWPVHWHRESDRGHYMLETIHKAKDGRLFPVEILVDRVNYAGKEFNCVYARDITERKRVEAALRESEDLLRRSQSVAHIGSYYFDVRTGKWISSPALDEIFGIDDSFPKNVDGWIALVHLEDKDEMLRHLTQHVLAEHNRFNKEYRLIRYDNQQERWMHGLGELEFDQSGNPVKMIGTIQDITERKLVEEALRTSQANLSLVFNNASDMQALFEIEKNQKLRIIAINHSYLTSLHSLGLPLFTADFFIGQYQDEVLLKLGFPKEGIEAEANHFLHAIESLSDVRWETVVPSPTKTMFIESTVVPVMNNDGLCTHLLYSSRDVTERKQAQEKIQASLHEKEVLLKEIHHRVKNNMQIMSSLLDLQAGNIKDAQVRELFKESQQRIKSMALIHERLYQSQDLAHINFAEYLQSLVNYIRQSYGARAAAITIQVKADPILLGVETAIPCGLIINELVSNALKHAFPDGRVGQIYLTLETNAENHLVLSVRDNGIGFPAEIDFRRTQSLGLTLVMTLIKQINGTIELKNQAGTEFRIIFLARGK